MKHESHVVYSKLINKLIQQNKTRYFLSKHETSDAE